MSSRLWVMPLSYLLAAGVSGASINVELRRDIEYARAGATILPSASPLGRIVPSLELEYSLT